MGSHLPEQFSPGSIINSRYQVVEHVGHGAMGSVLKVIDLQLDDAVVALKVLSPELVDSESNVRRFRSEVAIARKLAHPNILRLYDFDSWGSTCFISMEYVEGSTLKELIYRDQSFELSFDRRVELLLSCAKALAYLHQNNIVHRDIKPENILISSDGSLCKLADFGVARALGSDLHITNAGAALGTPYYMAPESFRGEHADFRADIYSFGILAWEIAAGHRPFSGSGMVELAAAHISKPLPRISSKLFDIPKWYQEMVSSCAEKIREERLATMEIVVDLLEKKRSSKSLLDSVLDLFSRVRAD